MLCLQIVTDNDNANNITFTIKGTKLYLPVVTLSARNNKRLKKLLSKGFERSVYWNEYKTKSENKNMTNGFRYFLLTFSLIFLLFVLVYFNQDNDSKTFETRRYYLTNKIIDNYNVIIRFLLL